MAAFRRPAVAPQTPLLPFGRHSRNSCPRVLAASSVFFGSKSAPTPTGNPTSYSHSPSESASPHAGLQWLHENLRSLLSYPTALPLCTAFGDIGENIKKYHGLERFKQLGSGNRSDYDNVLRDAMNLAKRNSKEMTENQITEAIQQQITKLEDINSVSVSERDIPGPNPSSTSGSGSSHIALSDVKGPLLLLEAGRGHKDWWAKLDQNSKYKQRSLTKRMPLLFAVMTLEKSSDTLDDWNCRIGVFHVVPKNHNLGDVLVSLLWRYDGSGLAGASKAFGKLLRASATLSKWRNQSIPRSEDFLYLGPNCCRLREKDGSYVVLRSYDDRCRETQRSPEIYKNWNDIFGGEAGECEVVLNWDDAGANKNDKSKSAAPAAYSKDAATDSKSGRKVKSAAPAKGVASLWNFDGSLLVVAVPYREGTHVPSGPLGFLSIVKQLKILHDKGYVHGDIRAFNCVFHGDEGWLIDFDFGGKISEDPRYPAGYKTTLNDGLRLGKGGDIITKRHDWYALGQLMFNVFYWTHPSKKKTLELLEMADFWSRLPSSGGSLEGKIMELEEFLLKAASEEWELTPSELLAAELAQAERGAGTMVGATGSPMRKRL